MEREGKARVNYEFKDFNMAYLFYGENIIKRSGAVVWKSGKKSVFFSAENSGLLLPYKEKHCLGGSSHGIKML